MSENKPRGKDWSHFEGKPHDRTHPSGPVAPEDLRCLFCGEPADHDCGNDYDCGNCCAARGNIAHLDKQSYDWLHDYVRPHLKRLKAAAHCREAEQRELKSHRINRESARGEVPNEVWVESCGTLHIAIRILRHRMFAAEASLLKVKREWGELDIKLHETWRCFHCGFSFKYEEALSHFGEHSQCNPACVEASLRSAKDKSQEGFQHLQQELTKALGGKFSAEDRLRSAKADAYEQAALECDDLDVQCTAADKLERALGAEYCAARIRALSVPSAPTVKEE